ncbi:metallophosphoesterase [Bdellovibrio bacteriovorus]|uniref:metallophosphoesterase n=1 Tax=Bdellovibrio bacteriovorus TaxID=959 RepID=UPI0035A64327
MRFSIIHISDIHVGTKSKDLEIKLQKLNELIKSIDHSPDNILFLLTGDLVHSGKAEEYELLDAALSELEKSLTEKNKSVYMAFSPGNHDCNLSGDQELRKIVLEKVLSYTHESPSESIISKFVEPQTAFFKFANKKGFCVENLKLVNEVTIEALQLKINIINTAWMSSIPEKQNIVIPLNQLEKIKRHNSFLNISIHHHPNSWFDRSTSSAMKKYIREFSDLIFTGHEHDPSNYSQQHSSNDQQYYFEAGEFHNVRDPQGHNQFFKILDIDIPNKAIQATEYCWVPKESYFKKLEPIAFDLYQGNRSNKFGETLAPNFYKKLKDPGMLISHNRKKNLELRDFYVFPKLEMNVQDEEGKTHYKILSSEGAFLEHFHSKKRLHISGEDKSGKSSFTKILYETLFSNDYLPLMIDGAAISNYSTPYLNNLIDRLCNEQYRTMNGDKYNQQDSNIKVLIIDDYDKIKLPPEKHSLFLKDIHNRFDRIILASDFNVSYNPVKDNKEDSIISYFEPFEIAPLTYSQTEALIEKWLQLGTDFNEQTMQLSPKQINNYIRTVISEYGVPNYPLFVVTYLRHIENERDFKADANLTSNEKLLSSLIDLTLATDSGYNIGQTTKKNYLTELSYEIYSSKKDSLSKDEFFEFHQRYCKIRDEDLKHQDIWDSLISTKILASNEGVFGFKYSYLQSYFLANYLRFNMTKPNFHSIMNSILEDIYLTKNSNTISTFSLYTSDPWLINKLIEKVDNILLSLEPASVLELSNALKEKIKISDFVLIPSKSVDDTSESTPQQKSDLDEQYELIPNAVRLIKLLGLVLKNSLDHLDKDNRLKVVTSIFNLSARILALQLKGLRSKEMELHINDMANRIKSSSPLTPDIEAMQEATGKVLRMVFNFTCAIVDLVSRSVGAESLKNTYLKISIEDDKKLFEFYQLAIKMEWFRSLPIDDLKSLYDTYEKDLLPRPILRYLTYKTLSLQLTSGNHAQAQAICAYLDMDINRLQIKKLNKASQ